MDLYLVLFAIAALGIVALVLIFLGHTKSFTKEVLSREMDEVKEPTTSSAGDKPSSRATSSPISKNTSTANFSDPALASLGFSAYDGLLSEPETAAGISISANPKLEQYHSAPPRRKLAGKEDLIILYLIAPPNQPFIGYELLQALLAANLRYGKMNVFHRYAEETDHETILFTVTSAVEPGIFDMANIGAVSCPGLSLFMSISATEDPISVFDLILETVQQLTEDLGGTLCNSERQPMTEEDLAGYRARILS